MKFRVQATDGAARCGLLMVHVQVASLGTDIGDNLFGDVRANSVVAISGYVWNDENADGLPAGEPRLAGAVVRLSSGMAQTTGADGVFRLYAPAGQAITVGPVAIGGGGKPVLAAGRQIVRSPIPDSSAIASQSDAEQRPHHVGGCVALDQLNADLAQGFRAGPRPVPPRRVKHSARS